MIALGYIDIAHSGMSADTERAAIEARARQARLELVEVLVIPRDAYMPWALLSQTLYARAVDVLIVPTVDHIWSARRDLSRRVAVEVVAPPASWPRGREWPAPAAAR